MVVNILGENLPPFPNPAFALALAPVYILYSIQEKVSYDLQNSGLADCLRLFPWQQCSGSAPTEGRQGKGREGHGHDNTRAGFAVSPQSSASFSGKQHCEDKFHLEHIDIRLSTEDKFYSEHIDIRPTEHTVDVRLVK